jgi:hypothetical protein
MPTEKTQSSCAGSRDLNRSGKGLRSHCSVLIDVKCALCRVFQTNKVRREEIPFSIQSQKLLKDLSKEIRHAERYLNSLNPPKPERESKRKKRKPVNKDFVDFSQPEDLEEPVSTLHFCRFAFLRRLCRRVSVIENV